MKRQFRRHRRKGNILVLTAVMMVVMIAFVAFAVDVGYLYTCRNELQRSADAAAIAAAWELVDPDAPSGHGGPTAVSANALSVAARYAGLNPIGSESPQLASDDVTIGFMANPWLPDDLLLPASGSTMPNAVQVRVQRTGVQNGEVPLFFARILGYSSAAAEAQATAALVTNIAGFRTPDDGSNLHILPFALDETTWLALSNGTCTDEYRYNADSDTITSGPDGIQEVNLYPQGTGSPGNRGTVDIGGSNNSTADISRQIVEGISPGDMEALVDQERSLEFNDQGELTLNGDTGISAGVKDELVSVLGKPRIIPVFRTVVGPGNNAEYTIVKFVGVRVMDVKLTGSMTSKRLMVQPCNIVSKGGIPSPGATTSTYIYSPVWLVR